MGSVCTTDTLLLLKYIQSYAGQLNGCVYLTLSRLCRVAEESHEENREGKTRVLVRLFLIYALTLDLLCLTVAATRQAARGCNRKGGRDGATTTTTTANN